MGVQTYLAYALPLLYANLNAFIRKESMADRFKDDKTKQDYTFYSMGKTSKKEKENGFLEAPSNGNRFFRKGVVGDGLNKLNSSQINLLEETFKSTLKKYSYNLKMEFSIKSSCKKSRNLLIYQNTSISMLYGKKKEKVDCSKIRKT